jgi:hypothetical protein
MGYIVIIDPWPTTSVLKSARGPIKIIHTLEVPDEEIIYTQLLGWLSYDDTLGWPVNTAQTFSRISTARFDPSINVDLWVDEDGIAKDLPINTTSEKFHYPSPLFGRVIVTGPLDGEGTTYPLKPEQLQDVKKLVGF